MYTKRISALALAVMVGLATWASEQHRDIQETAIDEQPGDVAELPSAVSRRISADC